MGQNVVLYNPHDLSDAHHLECLTCELTLVMHSIATMNLVTRYFRLHGEYTCSVLYHFIISESNITM